MLADQASRFVELAIQAGYLTEEQARAAAEEEDLSIQGGSAKERPFVLMLRERGLLTDEQIDGLLARLMEQVDTLVREARDLQEEKQFTRAIGAFSSAIETSPSSEEAYWGRAETCFEKRRYEEALADYSRLIEISPRKSEAHNRRGVVRSRLGQNEEAIADHQQAIALDPGNAKYHFDLGVCWHGLKELPKAIACYGQAIELRPGFVEALNNRAIARLMGGQGEQAKEDWQTALKVDPKRRTLAVNLFAVLRSRGKPR